MPAQFPAQFPAAHFPHDDGDLLDGRDGVLEPRMPSTAERGLLLVQADGFAPERVAVRAAGTEEVRSELTAEAVCIGRVVDAATKQPLAGARVFVTTAPRGLNRTFNLEPGAVATAADGRFRIGCLPAGPCALQVDHPDFAVPDSIALDLLAGDTQVLPDVALELLPRLRGRITGLRVRGAAMVGELSAGNVIMDGWSGLKYTPNRWLRPVAVGRDGTFDLGRTEARRVALELFLPPARYCGSPLSVPLGEVAPAEEVQEIVVPSPVACLVEGAVALERRDSAVDGGGRRAVRAPRARTR